MTIDSYFKKYGRVYGISYKYQFGWRCYCVEFSDLQEAREWLNTEQHDFRTRELVTKSQVIRDWGKSVFDSRDAA